MSQPEGAAHALRHAEERARQRLSADARTAELAGAVFEPVPDGLSNHGWRVRTARLDCFVRLARDGTQQLGADPHAECVVLREVARAGIAPPIVRCDPGAQLLVTQWIESAGASGAGSRASGLSGKSVTRQDAECEPTGTYLRRLLPGRSRSPRGRDERTIAVAARLAELHALVPPPATRAVDFATQARQLEHTAGLEGSGALLQSAAAVAFDALAAAPQDRALCHHDLHALNMLFDADGRLWLIDWEYAGLNDPVYDLASYVRQHGLPRAQRLHLLDAYRHAGGRAIDPARLEWACWTFDYVQWLWYRAAPLATDAGTTDALAMERRALALQASLRRRARNLLRCNNPQSAFDNARV
jgi:thiamine kinase-like enzyme